jgi:hypothetical protein
MRCQDMAMGGSWHNRLCAKHSGIITNFPPRPDIPRSELKNLLNYGHVLKRGFWAVKPDRFIIQQIKSGKAKPAIIAIDGFLTEGTNESRCWQEQFEHIAPDAPYYYLCWESQNLQTLGKYVGVQLTSVGVKALEAWAARIAVTGAARLSPIGWGLLAYSLATNPWWQAMNTARKTGIILADILARTDQHYILVGHSLGARVIYYTLRSLAARYPKQTHIHQAHLLGGATGNNPAKWAKCTQAVSGKIYNYYSKNDDILKILYQAGTAFSSLPIGRNEIAVSGVINCDVTEHVKGHNDYKRQLADLYEGCFL